MKRTAAAAAQKPEQDETEEEDPSSRVIVLPSGKLKVKGVDKFNKTERAKIVELVCAEKIIECRNNTKVIESINETVKMIQDEKQRTENQMKEVQKNHETKGLEFEALEEKFEGVKEKDYTFLTKIGFHVKS